MESKKSIMDDESYFKCYADMNIHEEMISDRVRTFTYRQAILRNYKHFYKKVVLDVGAGTGILSMFCVQAGAKKVYAVEASSLAEATHEVVAKNNMSDKITVIHSRVEDAELPEKVDVIVSEWMGYFLLYESMLPSVLHARDKWLKPGGLMFPSKAAIYLAPFTECEELKERMEFWEEAGNRYRVDLSTLSSYTRRCMCRGVHISCIEPTQLRAKPEQICCIDLHKVTAEDLNNVKGEFCFESYGWCEVEGFVAWFTVDFPADVSLSTSPHSPQTHWSQSILYIDHPMKVVQDSVITGTISLTPNTRYKRFLDVCLVYGLDSGQSHTQNFSMDDHLS